MSDVAKERNRKTGTGSTGVVEAKGASGSRKSIASHEEYIASLDEPVRSIVETIRKAVEREVPDAVRCFSYGMPSYRIDRIFFHIGAFKRHIGIYPPVKGDAQLDRELAAYRGPKGNLAFPLSAPLPYDLIARVAGCLASEHGRKGATSPAKRKSS